MRPSSAAGHEQGTAKVAANARRGRVGDGMFAARAARRSFAPVTAPAVIRGASFRESQRLFLRGTADKVDGSTRRRTFLIQRGEVIVFRVSTAMQEQA